MIQLAFIQRFPLKLTSLTRMSQYYSELGCRITALSEKEREARSITKAAAVAHKVAKLKLPLEFPKIRNPVTAKRR